LVSWLRRVAEVARAMVPPIAVLVQKDDGEALAAWDEAGEEEEE